MNSVRILYINPYNRVNNKKPKVFAVHFITKLNPNKFPNR